MCQIFLQRDEDTDIYGPYATAVPIFSCKTDIHRYIIVKYRKSF